MTTVGLELKTFIDPSLTWKTVSKGRNTSRRSRRPASKNLKMGQDQGRNNCKRLSGAQSSDSDKSDVSVSGRCFSGSMEHIPIKKRRFILRSPSPPPDHLEVCQERVQCPDQFTYCNGNAEPQVTRAEFLNGSVSIKSVSDGKVENTLDGARVSGGDISGTAILAATACSGRSDNTSGDVGKTSNGGGSFCLDGKEDVVVEDFPVVSPTDIVKAADKTLENSGTRSDDTEKTNDGAGFSCSYGREDVHVEGSPVVPPTDSIKEAGKTLENSAAASNNIGKANYRSSISCLHMKEDVHIEESPVVPSTDSIKAADKTLENSGATSDDTDKTNYSSGASCLRGTEDVHKEFPGVLPTDSVKDADRTLENSGATSDDAGKINDGSGSSCLLGKDVLVEESRVSLTDSNKVADKTSENSGATQDYKFPWDLNVVMDDWDDEVLDDAAAESSMQGLDVTSTDGINSHNTDNVSASESSGRTVAGGSGDIRSSAFTLSGHALEVSTDIVASQSEDYRSPQNPNDHAMETSPIVESKEYDMVLADVEIDQFLSRGLNDTRPSVLEQIYNCTPASEYHMNCEIPQATALEKSLVGSDNIYGEGLTQSAVSLPRASEIPAVESKDSIVSHCSKPENTILHSASSENEQAVGMIIAKEVKEKPTSSEGCVHPIKNGNFPEPKVLEKPTSTSLNGLGDCDLENLSDGVGHKVLVSSKELSQVTENSRNTAEVEGEYDSHLEDGELRETVVHCWEDNEGEYDEHVDYDSDNREGIFFEADNDSMQLSEAFTEEDGTQGDCLVNCGSTDDQPNSDKAKEQHCSLGDQGVVSAFDAAKAECTEPKSLTLKTYTGVQHKGEMKADMVEAEFRSDMEAGASGQEKEDVTLRNCGGASASGRELRTSDRNVDSTRSSSPSRSKNFDSMHQKDGLGEPLSRRYSLQTDRFDDRCWNAELKSIDVDDVRKEDNERNFKGSDETSPRVNRPRIISTSRSGYQFIRRGSRGERDNDYFIGMVKSRGISPDCNARSRFDRFSNGINWNFREGYRRPDMYEGGKSSGPMLNQFGKRERSFSPVENVGAYFPRGYMKSRSRSRTRSPDSWSSPRMGRGRPPYQLATNHASELMRDRRSPVKVFNQRPRFNNIGSPSRIRSDDCMRPTGPPVRFFDAAKSGMGHEFEENGYDRRKPLFLRNNRRSRSRSRSCSPDFRPDARMGPTRLLYQPSNHNRDRRSPAVRGFHPESRFDNGGSPGRSRSDDSIRPMMRHARFPNNAQSGRGHDYNNGEDDCRRKSQNIFERIHPVRRYDGGRDNVRRFQYDVQDNLGNQNFRRNENYPRSGDRRPVEMVRREERGNLRYNSDRMFYSGRKQFGGVQDHNEEALSRGVRS